MEDINIISFIIAMLIPLITRFIWFKDSVTNGLNSAKTRTIFIEYLALLFSTFCISLFFLLFNNDIGQEGDFDNFTHGAWHGAFVAVFIGLPMVIVTAYNNRMSLKAFLLNGSYWLFNLVVIGGIMDAMNHWPNQ